jgi:CheY-like chemotaxis protein
MNEKPLVICLIDDDPLNTFAIERLIKKLLVGSIVNVFHEAKNALASLETTAEDEFPHIILLDLYMPEIDGWQFLEQYQQLNLDKYFSTIYILSSSVDERDIAFAESHGLVQAFLRKPLEKSSLLELLEKHHHEINR